MTSENKTIKPNKGIQRDTIIDRILKKLNQLEFKTSIPNIDVAIAIEKSCFNEVMDKCKRSEEAYIRNWNSKIFINLYSARCGVIMSNIEKDSYMMKKLSSGEWKYTEIGSKTADDLDPESSSSTKKYLETRSRQKVAQKVSEIYTCPRCKNKKHTPPEGKQLRSADEGQSQFVTCLIPQCGHRFQVG